MAQTGFTPIQLYYSTTTSAAPLAANLADGELAINITDGKLFYKDNSAAVQVIGWKTVPTTAGGTGLTSYTAGDTVYYASGTALSKLAIGSSGYYMKSSGTAPQWSAPAALTKTDDTNVTLTLGGSASTALLNASSLTLGWTGQLAVTRGGTGLATVTQGDILYASAANTLASLGIGSANRVLTSSGTAPQWSTGLTLNSASVIEVTDNTNAALRITQLGTSDALLVEDSTNPDSTPTVIDADGRLVVGTTASQNTAYRLQSIGTNGGDLLTQRYTNGTGASFIRVQKSRSATIGGNTIVASGDGIGTISFDGSDGAGFITAASIQALVDGSPALNSMPGRLVFATTASGASTATARLRIDSSGYSQFLTNLVMPYQGAPTTKNAAATLTGAELVTGLLSYTGAANTITLPTGTDIEGALVWAGNDVSMDWFVINTGSGTCTIGANGNTTLGALTVAAAASGHFRIRRTGINAFTVYRLA